MNYLLIVILGMLCPIIFSLVNIIIITYLDLNYNSQLVFFWNMLGFITKTMFMIFMTYLGVGVLDLDFRIYIPILCSVWYLCHLCEAFYTQKLIANAIK